MKRKRPTTKSVLIDRRKLIAVLRDLEMIVVSLDRLGSAFSKPIGSSLAPSSTELLALNEFVNTWSVFRRLARARRVLSEPIEYDELVVLMADVPVWGRSPAPRPLSWRRPAAPAKGDRAPRAAKPAAGRAGVLRGK